MVKTSLGPPRGAGIGLWVMTSLTEPATGRWAEGARLGKVRCGLETQEMSILGGVQDLGGIWDHSGILDQHCDTVSGIPQSRGHSSWLPCLLPLCDCLHYSTQRAAFRLSWGGAQGLLLKQLQGQLGCVSTLLVPCHGSPIPGLPVANPCWDCQLAGGLH